MVPSAPLLSTIGKFAQHFAHQVATLGWDAFVSSRRGPSDLHPHVRHLPHPAHRLLDHLRLCGAPVLLATPPLSLAAKDAFMARGAHKSAHDHTHFLHDEFATMIAQGFWVVLPYSTVWDWPSLRLSPLGVVPQRERRPRTIVDYTFNKVNHDTVKIAPAESMQFGQTLHRLLQQLVDLDPRYGPAQMIKIDISDGFYRLWLATQDIPKLGVIFPTAPGEPPLVAFPLVLPMVESPPHFSAVTETICDLANKNIHSNVGAPFPHRLEPMANSPPPPPSSLCVPFPPQPAANPRKPPLATADVYVDDFIALAQTQRERIRVCRLIFQAIDAVLRPLSPTDSPHRNEPASVKKLLKGDAAWAHEKIILGWLLNTVSETIALPPH